MVFFPTMGIPSQREMEEDIANLEADEYILKSPLFKS